MNVKLKNGSIVDVSRMSVVELNLVVSDLTAQIKAKEDSIHILPEKEEKEISKLKEKFFLRRNEIKSDILNLIQTRGDVVALRKEENRKLGDSKDKLLLSLIKESMSRDDFMRFVEIADQRMKNQDEVEIEGES